MLVPLGPFKVCLYAKERVGSKSNMELPHLFIPRKTATLGPEFVVEDLPLGRTTALVPEFAVKNLPLGRYLFMCKHKLCTVLYSIVFSLAEWKRRPNSLNSARLNK